MHTNSPSGGTLARPGTELDPALLAFLKCHVVSPMTWEVLRLLEEHEGDWLTAGEAATLLRRAETEVEGVLTILADDAVVDARGMGRAAMFMLSPLEPTSVLLKRLLATLPNSQELRALIAAQVSRGRSSRLTAV